MSLIASVDVGTTSLRVGLFDAGGRCLTVAQTPLETRFPSAGRVEQDPEAMVTVTGDLLLEACQAVSVGVDAIDSVGIACQRGTFVAWDTQTGRPITPAIGWQDSRTQPQVDELRAAGIPVNTMASCTKIKWVLDEIPAAGHALSKGRLAIGTLDTWLTWKLSQGAAFITDPSNASATGLYDPGTGTWNEAALGLFGIDRAILPEIIATADGAASAAAKWSTKVAGTTIDTALQARAGDQQAACFAHGLRAGEAKLTLGTSAMLDLATGDTPVVGPPGAYALPLWRLPTGGPDSSHMVETYCLEGNIAAAGATIEWLVRAGLLASVDQLDAVAATAKPGPVVVPALAGLGSPHDNSAARGVFGGIGLETTAADLVLAAVDGIACLAAELCDALDVGDTLKLDGGLTRSSVMVQRLADVTGRTVLPAVDPELTMRGAAALAAAGGRGEFAPTDYAATVDPQNSETERQATRARFTQAVEASLNMSSSG